MSLTYQDQRKIILTIEVELQIRLILKNKVQLFCKFKPPNEIKLFDDSQLFVICHAINNPAIEPIIKFISIRWKHLRKDFDKSMLIYVNDYDDINFDNIKINYEIDDNYLDNMQNVKFFTNVDFLI